MSTISVFGNQDLDPIPVGTLAGDLLHVNRISGRDPKTGALGVGIEAQLKNAYANMKLAVENAGGSIDNIAHVSMYWADWGRDREQMNPPWVEFFPKDDDRPTYKFMPAPSEAIAASATPFSCSSTSSPATPKPPMTSHICRLPPRRPLQTQ